MSNKVEKNGLLIPVGGLRKTMESSFTVEVTEFNSPLQLLASGDTREKSFSKKGKVKFLHTVLNQLHL